jgi:hypothetical protein
MMLRQGQVVDPAGRGSKSDSEYFEAPARERWAILGLRGRSFLFFYIYLTGEGESARQVAETVAERDVRRADHQCRDEHGPEAGREPGIPCRVNVRNDEK